MNFRRNTILRSFFIPSIFLFLSAAAVASTEIDPASLLPAPAADSLWKAVGSPQTASGDDLYLLINGGAELYLEYGFSQALMVEYRAGEKLRINIEIYRMTDHEAAFGMYTLKKGLSSRLLSIGGETALDDYYINVWAGEFVCTLTGLDQDERTLQGLLELAGRIAARIPSPSHKPALAAKMDLLLAKGDTLAWIKGPLGFANRSTFPQQPPPGWQNGLVWRGTGGEWTVITYPNAALTEAGYLVLSETARALGATPGKALYRVERMGNHLILAVSSTTENLRGNCERLKEVLAGLTNGSER